MDTSMRPALFAPFLQILQGTDQMPFRIREADGLPFPVQTFFNAIQDYAFSRVLENLLSGVGCVINECACVFDDDNEEPLEGAECSIFDETYPLTLDELYAILQRICEIQAARCPNQAQEIQGVLNRYAHRYGSVEPARSKWPKFFQDTTHSQVVALPIAPRRT